MGAKRNSILLGIVLLASLASTAAAQNPTPYMPGYNWYGPPYTYYQQEHIPYFSLHPPVYYSMPVPRTYGYSPFAYPPGVMTPDVPAPTPVSIDNPFAPRPVSKEASKPAPDKTTVVPLTIINPYAVPISIGSTN